MVPLPQGTVTRLLLQARCGDYNFLCCQSRTDFIRTLDLVDQLGREAVLAIFDVACTCAPKPPPPVINKKPCPTDPNLPADDPRCGALIGPPPPEKKPCAYDPSLSADDPRCKPPSKLTCELPPVKKYGG